MDKEYIEVKGIKFEKRDDWQFIFPKGCLITPIYKRNKIVRVLVTNRKNRNVFYVESNTNKLEFINVDVTSMKILQGISYLIETRCYMEVLNTWILIKKNEMKQ